MVRGRGGERPRRPTPGTAPTGAVALLLLLALGGCSRAAPPPSPIAPGWREEGVASWYGHPFHGRQTASGEVYDMDGPTAAHRTLPFGTVIRVENLDNGRSTELRVNDRGPFARGRILDVSRRGALELGMIGPGTARVRIIVRQAPPPPADCWDVQVGSFREAANAEALRRRLEREGTAVRLEPAGQALTRVVAGPLPASEARRLARRHDGLVLACTSGA